MISHDSATILSLRYLEILKHRLAITIDKYGQPFFIPDRVKKHDLLLLKSELNDLFSNSSLNDALNATREFSNSHIQTVGFGLVTDFDLLVKLGLMYGERTVLWDLISSRLLKHAEFTTDQKMMIGQVACNLILLKPIIEDGGIVILPHPIVWCELAQLIDGDLREQNNKSIAKYGLSMALSTIESEIVLHPYTLLSSPQSLVAHNELNDEYEELYSVENYIFHQAISKVLADVRFAYLRDVKASEFFKNISQHPELKRELHTIFGRLSGGLTSQQIESEIQSSIEDINNILDVQNKELITYLTDGLETSALFATALLTVLSSNDFKETHNVAGLAITNLSIRLFQVYRKWFNTPKHPTIVQAFNLLQDQATKEKLQEHEAIPFLTMNSYPQGQDIDIQNHKKKFMSFHWVEERHDYLKELPLPIARKLLNSLDDSERYQNVNIRRFQEDYIGEYLSGLWEISEPSFWDHIKISFGHEDGILLADCMYDQILSTQSMPIEVWDSFLSYVFHIDPETFESVLNSYDGELIGRIVAYQVTHSADMSEKQDFFLDLFNSASKDFQIFVLDLLSEGFAGELPDWVIPHVK